MKRMIACEKCAQRKIKDYEGEWFHRVKGTAKAEFTCDYCGDPSQPNIKPGDKCAAESMGCHDRGTPYYPWEGEYINEAEEGK
jgi:hypothetical protein